MVKKIIVLAISIVFAVGSLVSYNVVNDKTVEFGAGTGVSRTISSVSELSDVLSKIPSFEEYSENANISDAEGRGEFSGVTVIETGYSDVYNSYRTSVRVPNQDEENETLYKSRNQSVRNHKLQMSFAPNAVYYHSIGAMWTATEYYLYYEEQETDSFYEDDFSVAYRSKTDYDVEIYHANDKTMFKINSYVTVEQRATRYEQNRLVYTNYTPETDDDEPDADEQFMTTLGDKMLQVREDSFGTWIEYPRAVEGEGEPTEPEDPFEGIEDMTEEQQMEVFINAMVQEFAYQLTAVAYQDLETVQQAHTKNKEYLGGLAAYITSHASDSKYFKRSGDTYELKGPEYVQEVRDPETNEIIEEGYTDYTVPSSYLADVAGITAYNASGCGYNAELDFTIGSDLVSINQKVNTWTKGESNLYETNTVIMNIDNTVVNLSKNAKTKTLDEVYVQPFTTAIRDLVTQMVQSQQGGNE